MVAKLFFERFWASDQRNVLFVCMPFHDAFDSRFNNVVVPAAKEAGFLDAVRVKENIEANVIVEKILDGIANSKMVLMDFTDDPKSACVHSRHVNGNVLYEAGIAHAMREPSSIVIIRDQNPVDADFDVRGLTINQPPYGQLTKEWLSSLLKRSLENHNWSECKRVKAAAESIDAEALSFMWKHGRLPKSKNHFHLPVDVKAEEKMSILRLLDLGILWFATERESCPLAHAYHWTPFGYEVMKYLAIKQIPVEEFEASEGHNDYKQNVEAYEKAKEEFKQKYLS